MVNADDIKLFSIVNADGSEVILSNLGAGIVSVVVPDRDGRPADVVLGYQIGRASCRERVFYKV